MNKLLTFWAIVFFTNALLATVAFALNYYFVIANNGPSTYQFGYDTPQENGAPRLMREEGRLADGTVIGRYGYTDPFGVFRVVKYAAGPNGYYAFEDIGGESSSEPLFFKATASQKEATVAEPEKSIPHLIATKFDPPLYHPEAHLAETPKLPDLDPDFRKLVFNAQQITRSHSNQLSNSTRKDESNDRSRLPPEVPFKRSTVGERTTGIDFDDDLGIPPKVFTNRRDGDILKELESIRIAAKPKPAASQTSTTTIPTGRSVPFQRNSWVVNDKQTTFRPQLSKDQELFLKNKKSDENKKVTFKPEPNIYPNERRFNYFPLNRAVAAAHATTTTLPPPTTYFSANTFIKRNRNDYEEFASSTATTTTAPEVYTSETWRQILPTTTEKVAESLVFSDFKSLESSDHSNATLNKTSLSSSVDSLSTFGERLNSDENIQSLKSIFSSFLKRSNNEKQLKDSSLIRHRFIETTTIQSNSSEDDLIGIESIKNKTSFEFPEKRFTRKQGFKERVAIKHITTTEQPTTTITPFTLPSIYYYDNKEFEQSLPAVYDVTNYPLSSYLNSATQSDTYPVYRKSTTTERSENYKDVVNSPTPIYKPAFRFLDTKLIKANETNKSGLKLSDDLSVTHSSDAQLETSTVIAAIDNLNTSLVTDWNQTEVINATDTGRNKISPLNDWSSRETNPISSDIDLYYDGKFGIESPEAENASKKKIVKVLLRKGELFYPGPPTSDYKFERKPKLVKLNPNSSPNSSNNVINNTKSDHEMIAHKTQIKKVISENRRGLRRSDYLETMQNNLKHGTLYVPPIGLLSLATSKADNDQTMSGDHGTHSATTKVNFYVPPIPVIHNTFNFGRLLESETSVH